MTYVEHYPTNPLSCFIDKMWYCKSDNLTATTLTIPLPNHELVFNLSKGYKIKKAGDTAFAIENPKAWVNGLQSKAYFSYSNGKHEMLGILFKANGFKAFHRYHLSDFFDNFIDASLLFGNSLQTLVQQIQDTASVPDKMKVTETFLLANLTEINYPKYLPHSMNKVSAIHAVKGSIKNVCNESGISNKSLISAFKKYVGISPVKYSHLQAINNALTLLSKQPKQSLTKLAYELNFYDQSHFINVFKSITSFTPSQYSTLVTNNQVDTTSPNFLFF